jgi:Flp pilus assembly pilin Flp
LQYQSFVHPYQRGFKEVIVVLVEMRRFLSDEAGPTIMEWAVLVLIILAFTVPALILIGGELQRIFEDLLSQLGRL